MPFFGNWKKANVFSKKTASIEVLKSAIDRSVLSTMWRGAKSHSVFPGQKFFGLHFLKDRLLFVYGVPIQDLFKIADIGVGHDLA